MDGNPTLGMITQKIEQSRLQTRIEQAKALPEFSLGLFSQTIIGTQEVDGQPVTYGTGFRFNGIQAGIAVPVWFAPQAARVKAARIGEKIAASEAAGYKLNLSGDYQALLEEYDKYAASVAYYENQAVPEADQIIGQATKAFKAGGLDYADYVVMLGRALTIRQNWIEALGNLRQTAISLENVTGKIF